MEVCVLEFVRLFVDLILVVGVLPFASHFIRRKFKLDLFPTPWALITSVLWLSHDYTLKLKVNGRVLTFTYHNNITATSGTAYYMCVVS